MSKDVDELLGDVLVALADDGETPSDEDNLFEWGLDSITLMRVANQWRRDGVTVSFAQLSKNPTLRGWRKVLSAQLGESAKQPTKSNVDEGAEVVSGEPFPLAPMQHAYWIGRTDEVALGSVAAHLYVEFDGSAVDPTALEAAVRALVDRHEMLRAVFTDNGMQRIAARRAQPALVVHDLRESSAVDTELERLRQERSHARLDVAHGEVFAIALSLLPGGRTRLHVDVDMLAADALSYRVLLADLARLYQHPEEPLAPIGYSYQGYLAARPGRRAEARAQAREWWQHRIPDLPSAPDLPLVPESRQVDPSRVTRRHHWLSSEDRKRLTVRAHRHGLTPAMVVATAFAEVLGAWSGQPRFLLNVPMFDREDVHPDVGKLLGDFTSSVLLDVDLTERRSFVEDARLLQERMHTDAAHAAYSGVEVLRDLSRHHGEQVLAPVVFTSALNLGELFDDSVRRCFGDPVWIISQGPQVVLDAQVTEVGGGLLVNWDVREHAFPAGLVAAMFDAFLGLLDTLGEDERAWLEPVPALLPASQTAVRDRANATDGPRSGRLLADGFFDRAARDPAATALCWGTDGTLSYGELSDRALRVARSLVDAGVTPGDPVAVSLPKGPDQIVAVLGVLAAGGTYVPIGVDQPEARRDRIRAVAGVRHTLTGLTDALRGEPLDRPVRVAEEALAYVLFTSGSTGEPKGVEVPHRAAVNTIDDLNERFGISGMDPEEQPRCLAVSALDFDLSVYDIFGLLAAGGAVVLVAEADRKDAQRWAELARIHRITLVNCVPALLDMLLRASGPGDLASLRTVLLGGDWVGTDLPGRVAEAAPGCRFAGLGGTTETAIHSTVFEVDDHASVPEHWRSIPYGTPLRNVRCRVVDARGRDCPDWVTGELWIGGDGVAHGYRADPARTAEKFVTHQGMRWYRTGDLARYWPDGTLEFLGRSDHQVKVRGVRIELGEVEAALAEHEEVRAVVAGVSGGQLVAAVSGTVTGESARDWLRGSLPPHMIPSRIVVLDDMPLTHNGKIDRRAVAALWPVESGMEGAHAAPETALEKVIARVWAEVLQVDRVGVDDPFFAIGGDSVLATQIVAALREALDTDEVSVRALFASPTVGRLARRLADEETEPGRLAQVAEIYLEVAELSAEELDAELSS
jgi:mycobactin phenyloxazoline synthetase